MDTKLSPPSDTSAIATKLPFEPPIMEKMDVLQTESGIPTDPMVNDGSTMYTSGVI